MTYLIVFLSLEIGLLLGWVSFDVLFHQPLRKIYREQNKDMKEFLDGQIAYMKNLLSDVGENGSIISPIQIKKEE